MPILDQARPCCFLPIVGVVIPQLYDIWASFGDPFLISKIRPELTSKGEDLLVAKKHSKRDHQEIVRMFWTLKEPTTPKERGSDEYEKKKLREEKRISELILEANSTNEINIIEKYPKEDGNTICTCQRLARFDFWEAQLLTKAQVKSMVKPSALSWLWQFNAEKKSKINFSHCVLWWRD